MIPLSLELGDAEPRCGRLRMRPEPAQLLEHLLLRLRVVPGILREEPDREAHRTDPRDDAEDERIAARELQQAAREAPERPRQARSLERQGADALLGCPQACARPRAGFAQLLEPLVRPRQARA